MARTILYCKDWLRFNLTAERLTDYTEASRHYLDVASGTISDALAERLGMADATALVPPINPADALGGRVDWIRSTLGLADTPWSEIEVEAEQAGPDSGGVLYLPYGSPGGERAPFQDTNASASWLGMSVSTTRQQILRAVYEGVAFSLIECVDVLGSRGISSCPAAASAPIWCAGFSPMRPDAASCGRTPPRPVRAVRPCACSCPPARCPT